MRMPRVLAVALLLTACPRGARKDSTPVLQPRVIEAAAKAAATPDWPVLTQAEMIEHVLGRITFGPRRSDRERVRAAGIAAFVEEQLHPEQLNDDAVTQKLSSLEVLKSPPDVLVRRLYSARKDRQQAVAAADVKERPREVKREYVQQLSRAKLLRAVSSQRQLREVMVDFWFNHFNVFSGKSDEAALLPEYEAKALRQNALATFPQLLEATAHSPAMLVYLDNWRSSVPKPKARQKRGLNENYARELLELHTLGVDGGYTQADVVEVARCFSGWTVGDPQKDPRFMFKPEMHDFEQKIVLGHLIPAGGGVEDALQVLHILETHPATARFVAMKLVRRFVSDDPPDALVRRVADAYTATSGDIRSMLRAILESPEFWSRKALRAKVRSPLELVAASARALNASVDDPLQLAKAVARIGQPLYGAQPPTGYPDVSQAWLSSGALLARIDFGLSLAGGRLEGVSVDLSSIGSGSPAQVLTNAATTLGANNLSARTRGYILEQLEQTPQRPDLQAARAVGLLLGAPELQRR
jgi:uncharacterized protein (DUF1800 family)